VTEAVQAEVGTQKSFLVRDEDSGDVETEPGEKGTVPVSVVADLRAKNRELKQQLEQANTRPAAETAEDVADPLAGLDDDDFMTAGQVRALRANDKAAADRRVAQTAAAAGRESQVASLLQSEKATREAFPDYDAVMEAADAYLSPDEFHAALRAKNPGKALYAKAKQVVAALGESIESPTSKKAESQKEVANEGNEVLQTDEEVFDELFAESSAT
jgi:hypothetical protein